MNAVKENAAVIDVSNTQAASTLDWEGTVPPIEKVRISPACAKAVGPTLRALKLARNFVGGSNNDDPLLFTENLGAFLDAGGGGSGSGSSFPELRWVDLRNNSIKAVRVNARLQNMLGPMVLDGGTVAMSGNNVKSFELRAGMGEEEAQRWLDWFQEQVVTTAEERAGVTRLRITTGSITEAKARWWKGLVRLEELDLPGNQLSNLTDEGLFNGLPALQMLDLRANQLATLSINTFAKLTALQELRLSGNRLVTLANNTFAKLTALQKLRLYNNPMSASMTARLCKEVVGCYT